MKKILPLLFLILFACKKEPADSDNDGVIDAEDQCPELVGLAQYQGCPAYTLTVNVNPSEGGSVSPSSGEHKHGTSVSLTATPAGEYLFENWSGDASGNTASVSVSMMGNKTVTANFIKKKYPLTIEIDGEGSVDETVIQPGLATDYNSGTIVELTANPKEFWKFVKWEGDLTGEVNPSQITMDGPKNVKVVFQLKDSDGDGVTDDTDQCPDTPEGKVINDKGCMLNYWSLAVKSEDIPEGGYFQPYAFDREGRTIYLYQGDQKKIISYNIDSREFNQLNTSGLPGQRGGSIIYNPSKDVLQVWGIGTDNAYEGNKGGGNFSQIGNGSNDGQKYSSNNLYNGSTKNPTVMHGYGYWYFKNYAFELKNGSWVQVKENSNQQPYKRYTHMYPNSDYTKAYIIDGNGNKSGNQFDSSCDTGGLPWATDTGIRCWLRDIWEVDLSNWTFKQILPMDSDFGVTGNFGYDYEGDTFFSFGGFIPPEVRNQTTLKREQTLRIFNPSTDDDWKVVEQEGDIPPGLGNLNRDKPTGIISYYDEKHKRFILCSRDGIWEFQIGDN